MTEEKLIDVGKGAWHGDPELKAQVVARMREHREKDEIIQGVYQEHGDGDSYRGCLIGCTLPRVAGMTYNERQGFDWHEKVEQEYGIPRGVASILDSLFEDQEDFESAAAFAVESIEAIPVGADLSELARIHGAWQSSRDVPLPWFFSDPTDVFLEYLRGLPVVAL